MYTSPYVTYLTFKLDIWPHLRQKMHSGDPASRPNLLLREQQPKLLYVDLDWRLMPLLKRLSRRMP